MPMRKIVVHHGVVTALEQLPDDHASDITCTASNQDAFPHEFASLSMISVCLLETSRRADRHIVICRRCSMDFDPEVPTFRRDAHRASVALSDSLLGWSLKFLARVDAIYGVVRALLPRRVRYDTPL